MLFLEQFILASGGRLTLSVLEECFPFTLVRTKYIQVYQQQSIGTSYGHTHTPYTFFCQLFLDLHCNCIVLMMKKRRMPHQHP
jgi:hypothetical protein